MAYEKVTDKQYSMDSFLISNLNFCVERQEKKWDNLAIIDGMEGVGKSTLSFALAYYWAWITKREFTLANVFFETEKMLKFAQENVGKIILWDEAAWDALAQDNSVLQRKLIKILMMCRNRGHYWIFNIPKFYRLKEYIAVDRSFFLIHCYSPDYIKRGHFTFHNTDKKELIYELYRSTKKKRYDIYDFAGEWPQNYTNLIINEDEYNVKKNKAIASLQAEPSAKENKSKQELIFLKQKIATFPTQQKILCDHLNISRQTLHNWKNLHPKDTELTGQVTNHV